MFRKMLFQLAVLTVGLSMASVAQAQVSKHAVPKTAKITLTGIKKMLGVIVFAVEDGVDVIHAATFGADKALLAAAPAKILIPVEKVVHAADYVVGKADTGLENAETVLFGSSN